MPSSLIGFVTGLTAEARLLAGVPGIVAVGGGTPAGAADAVSRLIDAGVGALVSFGLCGGLDPALRPGFLVVPEAVLMGDDVFLCDAGLLARFGGATISLLCAADATVATIDEKAALFAATHAAAVDLESGVVAEAARRRGLAFAVARVVIDTGDQNLPPASVLALDAAGRIAIGRIVASILREPGQLGGLLRLAIDAPRARRSLQKFVALRLRA